MTEEEEADDIEFKEAVMNCLKEKRLRVHKLEINATFHKQTVALVLSKGRFWTGQFYVKIEKRKYVDRICHLSAEYRGFSYGAIQKWADETLLKLKNQEGLYEFHRKWKQFNRLSIKLPDDAADHPDKHFQPGDEVNFPKLVPFYTHSHSALYIGGNMVRHIWGTDVSTAKAQLNDFQEPIKDHENVVLILVVYPLRIRTVEAILDLAKDLCIKRYGEGMYSLIFRNCQHFVSRVITDTPESFDVELRSRQATAVTLVTGSVLSLAVLCSIVISAFRPQRRKQ